MSFQMLGLEKTDKGDKRIISNAWPAKNRKSTHPNPTQTLSIENPKTKSNPFPMIGLDQPKQTKPNPIKMRALQEMKPA